MMPHLLV